MTALEQAGSLLNGWAKSCWSCLFPEENEAVHRLGQHHDDRGVEREMQVCQTQPHLVPPMKLTVYDDLPSPGFDHERRNSLSNLLEEGRSLASRASHRASMSISRKRNTMTPISIGAPTDFRRVQSYQTMPPMPTQLDFKPLELSIHRGGKRLSDLPEFDPFLADDGTTQRPPLAVPPRALSSIDLRSRRCHSTASNFSISRKPVGSGVRASVANIEPVIQPPPPARIASGLIPHFSLLRPLEVDLNGADEYELVPPVPPFVHQRTESELTLSAVEAVRTSALLDLDVVPKEVAVPKTPVKQLKSEDMDFVPSPGDSPLDQDSPSTASLRTFPSRISSLRRPSNPAENRNTIAYVPLPNRVSKWFFPEKASAPQAVSLAGENGFEWDRTRTLSGTTVGSITTTTITGGPKHRNPNASISSNFSNPFTPRASMHSPSLSIDKTIDSGIYHPSIYEDRPKSRALSSHPVDQHRLNESTIGLAF